MVPRWDTVTLMGLGGYEKGSGVSAAKFLAPRCKKLIITDVKTKERLTKNVRALSRFKNIVWHLGGHQEEDFIKTDWVIRNPGVRADNPYLVIAKKHKIPIDNDITLFLRLLGSVENVIGVTGTRGKTTTAHLIHAMIAEEYPNAWLGGNVGRSPLGIAFKDNQPIILELSSFLLHNFDSIKKSPHIAVLTNLYPDHLNAYPSLQKYFADKKNIYRYQKRGDFLIINDDDPMLKKIAPKTRGTVVRFSAKRKVSAFSLSDFKLPGDHNIANLLAAIAVAKVYGISDAAIRRAIKKFRGVPYRLELVRTVRGVNFVNDTTATTPEGAIAGLKSFPKKKIILITGGNSKGLSLAQFAKEIRVRAKTVILLPGNANKDLPKGITVKDMREAVHIASKHAKRGDAVLLSPGLSWLPVMNEFQRGDEFVKQVKRLS